MHLLFPALPPVMYPVRSLPVLPAPHPGRYLPVSPGSVKLLLPCLLALPCLLCSAHVPMNVAIVVSQKEDNKGPANSKTNKSR